MTRAGPEKAVRPRSRHRVRPCEMIARKTIVFAVYTEYERSGYVNNLLHVQTSLTRAKLFRERRTNRSKLLKNMEGRNLIIETWKLTALPRKREIDVRYFKDFPGCMKRETKIRKKNRRLNETVLSTIFILGRRIIIIKKQYDQPNTHVLDPSFVQ